MKTPTTKGNSMGMKTATYDNRKVWIIGEDEDPTCAIWIAFIDDPDDGRMVMPKDLTDRGTATR